MKKAKSYFLVIILIIFMISCGKNFNDINIDPNNPVKVPAAFLFTSGSKFFADQNCGCDQAYFGWLWAQYLCQNNYTELSRYQTYDDVIYQKWQMYYADALYDLQEVIKITEAFPGLNKGVDRNIKSISKILMTMIYQDLTDIFGPIPYQDALQGNINRTPKYNSQREVYLGLLNDLKDAILQIDQSEGSFGTADPIYSGNVSNWKKFANTLRMRIAIRMADIEPAIAKEEVEGVYLHAFEGNQDNAYFHYLTNQPNNNLFNECRIARYDADIGMSNVLIDNTLVTLNDPRLEVYSDPKVDGGGFLGRPFGQLSKVAASESPDLYSQPSGASIIRNNENNFKQFDIVRPDALGRIMSYAEVCFILAESIERGWNIPGTAKEWYDKGVTASLEEWGINDPLEISNYLAQTEVNYNTATGDWKQKIGVQKWIALFLQGTQGWNEWRRLDFEKLQLPVGGVLKDIGNKVAPVRLTYPVTEQTQNTIHYFEAVGLLDGPDKLSTRVWWDVK